MSNFNYQEYLRNNPLLKEEVKDQLITESQEVEEVELPSSTLTKTNSEVTNIKTMAQAMLDFFNQVKEKEAVDFEANVNMKVALDRLKKLAKIEEEAEEVTEKRSLNEDVLGKLKDKVLSVADKIKNKFSDVEVAKMKSIVKTALGKDQLEPSDITLDNLKKVINVMKGQLAEGQLEESLEDKIEDILGPILPVGGFLATIGGLGSVALGNSPILLLGGIVAMIIGGLINKNQSFKESESLEVTEESTSKMKVSELKAKIKEDIISLLQEEDNSSELEDELIADLDEEITEAEEDEDVEVEIEDEVEDEIEDEVGGGDAEALDPEAGLSQDEQDIQNALKVAYDNAVELGDEKLSKQIGNTITMFTRTRVVGDLN